MALANARANGSPQTRRAGPSARHQRIRSPPSAGWHLPDSRAAGECTAHTSNPPVPRLFSAPDPSLPDAGIPGAPASRPSRPAPSCDTRSGSRNRPRRRARPTRSVATVSRSRQNTRPRVRWRPRGRSRGRARTRSRVAFDYLFLQDSTGPTKPTELVVHLSDSPDVSTDLEPVALVWPPAGGPGSIGSGQFARFHGTFPRGGLNFTRGTYVELELRGTDAAVRIDNFDPTIGCAGVCL